MPFATTTIRLRPSGAWRETVNLVVELAFGAVDTELQPKVRA
jgi:hypothetical protein